MEREGQAENSRTTTPTQCWQLPTPTQLRACATAPAGRSCSSHFSRTAAAFTRSVEGAHVEAVMGPAPSISNAARALGCGSLETMSLEA